MKKEYWATDSFRRNVLMVSIVIGIFIPFYVLMLVIYKNPKWPAISLIIFHTFLSLYFLKCYMGIKKFPVVVISDEKVVVGNQFGYGAVIPIGEIVSIKEERIGKNKHAILIKRGRFWKNTRINSRALSEEHAIEIVNTLNSYVCHP